MPTTDGSRAVTFGAGDVPATTGALGVGAAAAAALSDGNGMNQMEPASDGGALSATTSENNINAAQSECDGYQCTQVSKIFLE